MCRCWQIVGVVDVFDALTTERPYRQPVSRDEAFAMLTDEAARGWRDRALVDAFIGVVSVPRPDVRPS